MSTSANLEYVRIVGAGSRTSIFRRSADEKKSDLLKRLREAEQQQDFYSGLYRQYTTNLLKLVIYVRSLLSNERAKQYLQALIMEKLRKASGRRKSPSQPPKKPSEEPPPEPSPKPEDSSS